MLMYDKKLDTYYEVIPVSKIEEKIEEIKEEIKKEEVDFDWLKNCEIEILQQLIEENKEEE